MAMKHFEVTVPEEYHLHRVDRFLTGSLEYDLSRSYIQKLIKKGHITREGEPVRQNYRIKTDDVIRVEIPEPEKLSLEPADIPLEFIYQDESIAVINKQAGLVVHPGPGNWDSTLVNALLFHLEGLSSIGGTERPGIVHRLDRDTAGLMVIARNDAAHRHLVKEFSERRVIKKYRAIVVGKPAQKHGLIELPLGRHRKYRHKMTVTEDGRHALTEYDVSRIWNTGAGLYTLLDVRIHTGRTHQIRVHLSSSGLPIVGDPIYSKKWEKYRVPWLLLASVELGFIHPETGEEVSFSADMPAHMRDFIERIERSRA